MLEEKTGLINASERVLIVGASGTGKTLLFRALAGLWPWGAGRVTHPSGEELLYMPRTPYCPPGTLREILAYPSTPQSFDGGAFSHALSRLGLERLAPKRDATLRWDRQLSEDEQQKTRLCARRAACTALGAHRRGARLPG